MKKVLLFLFAAILLVSCSSEQGETALDNGKKYPVTFNVSGFRLETTPLPRAEATVNRDIVYAVYDQSGAVVVTGTAEADGQNIKIKEDLSVGTYNVVFIACDNKDLLTYTPVSFETDACYGMSSFLSRHNTHTDIFYKSTSLTVTADETRNTSDISMNPMWSIINVNVEDAAALEYPDGTATVYIHWTPAFRGFYVKDGTAFLHEPNSVGGATGVSLSAFKSQGIISNAVTVGLGDCAIKLGFRDGSNFLLGEKTVWTGNIKAGNVYNFKGRFTPEIPEPEGFSFTVSYGELGEVNIPIVPEEEIE